MRAVVLVLSMCLSVPAFSADKATTKSRALFKKAQQTYDKGEIAQALELYLQAYEAKALPGFLFNIAQCHRQLRNYERAGFYFKRYLDLVPMTPNAQVVRDLISEVEGKQAEVEELKRSEVAAARAQEVELARITAAQAENDAAARRVEEARNLELARALKERPVEPASGSVLTKWWLWAGVGVVVAGAAAGAVYVGTAPSPRPTTLGTESAR